MERGRAYLKFWLIGEGLYFLRYFQCIIECLYFNGNGYSKTQQTRTYFSKRQTG